MLLCCLRADFKKLKRMPVVAAHVVIPVGAAAVFLLYCAHNSWEDAQKPEAYYQVLGMGFPFLIGVFSAMLAEQEQAAGSFQNMLSARRRASAFFSKLVLLVSLGAGAVLLASLLFGAGFYCLPGERTVGGAFYAAAAFVLLGSNLFFYVLHLILAFAMNRGVTLGAGIVESLLSALLLTGMGEGIWPFVPAAWGSRLVTPLLHKFLGYDIMGTDWVCASVLCAAATAGGLAVFLVWACRWEGGHSGD